MAGRHCLFGFEILQLSLTLTLLVVHASNPSDYFQSLDCGLVGEPSYKDNITGLTYQSDENFIDSGESYNISSQYKNNAPERQFWYVRSFPRGKRNCYAINNSFRGNDSIQYLIRVRFMYGNYDHKNRAPRFDLHLGATFWDSVEFEDASSIVTKEIVYSSIGYDHIHVCLFNSDNSTPFISALEVRMLINYGFRPSGMAQLLARFNFGSFDDKLVRYPDDVQDRIWTPYMRDDLKPINASQGKGAYEDDAAFWPSIVMRTAATPANASSNISLPFPGPDDNTTYYSLLYFAEIEELHYDQLREFVISVSGDQLWDPHSEPVRPRYLHPMAYPFKNDEVSGWRVWINRTNVSTLPPLLNAIEVYALRHLKLSETQGNDYDAISNIKTYYGINTNWQGDPCTPTGYMWEGLGCDFNESPTGNQTYQIRSLNLSSRNLSGKIAPWISNLRYILELDLSNNNLTGDVPDFLSQLKFLRVLNIEGNELSGTIPADLIRRSNNGSLQLRCGRNPGLCCPGPCKKEHKDNMVIIVAALFGGAFIIVVASIGLSIFFKKREQVGTSLSKLGFCPNISKRLMLLSNINKKVASKKQQLTYDEILTITSNFEKVVGKGGFGTVYHGQLGNTQVAVKVLSPSTQGYLQFQAEANLLTRVHHKCLTPLLGYCHEGTNIALVYEYMPNGDLANCLSDSEKILSWKQRIQISVDAAEGLEYLHNGCKPPIIHRDIKSRNILLNEKLRGKIADFGLSKIFSNEGDTHVFTVIAGTPGYLDPEYYLSNRLNEKSDVFGLGVVLLELITGRPAISKNEEKPHIIQWVCSLPPEREINDIVDSRLQGEFESDSARLALDTAMACVAQSSINRPSMSEVVVDLKQCLDMEITRESDSNGRISNSFVESDNHRSIPIRSIYVSNLIDSFSVESSLLR